jgi:hypothetical protein
MHIDPHGSSKGSTEFLMKKLITAAMLLTTVSVSSSLVGAAQNLVTQKNLSTDWALSIAHEALDKCHPDGVASA